MYQVGEKLLSITCNPMYFFFSFDYTPHMIGHQRNSIFSALVQSKYGAQVSQHMVKIVFNEHLYIEFVFTAHAQSCLAPPSSGTSKMGVPACITCAGSATTFSAINSNLWKRAPTFRTLRVSYCPDVILFCFNAKH